MENYIFFRNNDADQDNANDAAMFPAASVMAIQPGDAVGTTIDIHIEPRDCDVPFADGATAHVDIVELTYPATTPFDVIAQQIVERINAIGPFTVVADAYDDGGDANTPGPAPILEVTNCTITSAE